MYIHLFQLERNSREKYKMNPERTPRKYKTNRERTEKKT